jgi:3-dehydroquinate dehydratase-1
MILEKSSFVRGIWTVGSVSDAATIADPEAVRRFEGCDVVEYRVDCWPGAVERAAGLMEAAALPALVTVRAGAEGGRSGLTTARREALFRRLLPVAAMVDIEIACMAEFAGVVAEAKERGVLVVGSSHDFERTPTREELVERIGAACAAGADIVKFAAVAGKAADVAVLASLLEEPEHPPLSVMGMGGLGRVSRLLLAQLGSVLNYGYIDNATVSGQWSASRLRTIIGEIRADG